LFEDFLDVLEGMEGAERLVKILKKFTEGLFANFFNQYTNVALDKSLIVFGIRDMEQQLKPLAMYICTKYVWDKIRESLKKRILVVDEAWLMLSSKDSAAFFYGIVKRARKYYLGVTAITQDVKDFLDSPFGHPMITNSALIVLFKQLPVGAEFAKNAFNLTDEEKLLILEGEVGEGIFFAGGNHALIKVVASPFEEQIITTSPEEILKLKAAKKL
jgi:type IV secretory pathway VirB4 component